MKPIENRSEHHDAEECLAKIFVPGANSAATLHTGKEVFDHVAVTEGRLGKVVLSPTRNAAGTQ